MTRRVPIAPGEWYHCYNRGVDRRRVFLSSRDYERFLMLLYISNGTHRTRASNFSSGSLTRVLGSTKIKRGAPLVEIGAYCLMPNHAHFILKESVEGGIAAFMQKVFTGYTMYFNGRHERTGPLFSGSYKSKHLSTDRYFKHAINYVHMNPVELYEPGWKSGTANIGKIAEKLRAYRYSSLNDHTGESRPESAILGKEVFTLFDSPTSLSSILFDAQAYYREIGADL